MAHDLDAQTLTVLADAVEQFSDRGLGDLVVRSSLQSLQEASVVPRAADNLLGKAVRALDSGDTVRAQRFVDRAMRLPRDEMAEADAALASAHQRLYDLLTDAIEDSRPGDVGWLDAVEATLPRCNADPRVDLLEAVHSIATEYEFDRDEMRRIRRIAPADSIGDVMLERDGADQQTVRRLVLELLDVFRILRDELAERDALPER